MELGETGEEASGQGRTMGRSGLKEATFQAMGRPMGKLAYGGVRCLREQWHGRCLKLRQIRY